MEYLTPQFIPVENLNTHDPFFHNVQHDHAGRRIQHDIAVSRTIAAFWYWRRVECRAERVATAATVDHPQVLHLSSKVGVIAGEE